MNEQPIAAPQDDILRGFEIVRCNRLTRAWERISVWRPTELAAKQAAMDLLWFRERYPNERYEMRAVVSVGARVQPQSDKPLVLDADEPANAAKED